MFRSGGQGAGVRKEKALAQPGAVLLQVVLLLFRLHALRYQLYLLPVAEGAELTEDALLSRVVVDVPGNGDVRFDVIRLELKDRTQAQGACPCVIHSQMVTPGLEILGGFAESRILPNPPLPGDLQDNPLRGEISRCPIAESGCHEIEPELRQIGNRKVACHLV